METEEPRKREISASSTWTPNMEDRLRILEGNKFEPIIQALDILLRTVVGTLSPPLIDPPADYKPGDFFEGL